MSDLVSRLAARVVGAATTTAGPRPVPLFGHGSGSAADDVALADADGTEITSRVEDPVETATRPTLPAEPERIDPVPATASRSRQHDSRPLGEGPGPMDLHRVDDTGGSPTTVVAAVGAVAPRSFDRGRTPEPAEDRSAGDGRRQVAHPPAVVTVDGPAGAGTEPSVATAVPPTSGGPPPRPPGPPRRSESPADHTSDERVVRIHIGRLDVRTAPEPARPPGPPHRPTHPPEPRVGLDDYLRGRREEP